jgi:hypothetical protein
MAIWSILWSFGIFFRFGILQQEKSGNPDQMNGEREKTKMDTFVLDRKKTNAKINY